MRCSRGDLSTEARSRYSFIRSLLRAHTGSSGDVVELGAAPGDQAAALANSGYRMTAVDIGIASDAWATGEAGRMERLLRQAGVRLVTWNLEVTPYPLDDACFDAVIMTEVYEHLREYPATSLDEAFRILRPGGHLYFSTPNAASLMNRCRLLLGRSVGTPLPDWIAGIPFARHVREYTFSEIRQLLERAGFDIAVLTSRHFNVDTGRTGPIARSAKRALGLIARMRPTLGPSIVAVAQRPAH